MALRGTFRVDIADAALLPSGKSKTESPNCEKYFFALRLCDFCYFRRDLRARRAAHPDICLFCLFMHDMRRLVICAQYSKTKQKITGICEGVAGSVFARSSFSSFSRCSASHFLV